MTPTPIAKKAKPRHHPALFFTLIVTVVAAVLLGTTLILGAFVKKSDLSFPYRLNKDKYYAVFLDNGQVYFGHLAKYFATKNPVLYDIYYLQTEQELQSSEKKEGEQKEPQFNLVKLGQELHGPKDAMLLNKEHVLFVEELKDDGQVVKAIVEHKKK